MKYDGRIDLLLSSEVQRIQSHILDTVLQLAENEGCSLSAFTISEDSKIASITKIKVRQRLKDDLRPFLTPIGLGSGALSAEAGLLVAFDDANANAETVVGFIDFRPRPNTETTAYIGAIVVSPAHRNKGVMKAMVAILEDRYPELALDCSLNMVAIYEHLGFFPIEPLGAHVVMSNGVAAGKPWKPETPTTPDEEKQIFTAFQHRLVQQIGKDEYDKAVAELTARVKDQEREVVDFFAKLFTTIERV